MAGPAEDAANENTITNATPEQPVHGEVQDDQDGQEENGEGGVVVNANYMSTEMVTKKKKKKRRKPASQRGMGKPTGFEDNFADAPLTPEQYAEARELFHPDLPFVERILRAIQRFERTRRLLPERRDVFYKYLAYGGIDVGPNMFQGAQDTEDMDKDQIASTLAQTSISDKRMAEIKDPKSEPQAVPVPQADSETIANVPTEDQAEALDPLAHLGPSKTLRDDHKHKYVVDFVATMRTFLSRRAPTLFALDTADRVALVTTTLERFMDYLLQHDVCPEYQGEMLETRNLCRAARTELWDCVEVQRWLPGDFNIACSTLFGGQYARDYDGQTYWGESQPGESTFVGLTHEKASQIMGFAMAAAATDDLYSRYEQVLAAGGKFEIVKTIEGHGFEIIDIQVPTSDCLEIYKSNTDELRPVGTVKARFWRNPDAPPEDLTPQEKLEFGSEHLPWSKETLEFFLEGSTIIPHLKVGQKIECTMHRLECGIWFFDEALRIYPSFELWIENEMTYGWKEAKPLKGALDYVETNDVSSEKGDANDHDE